MSLIRVVGKSFLTRGLTLPISLASGLLTTSIVVSEAGASAYGAISLISTLFMLIPFSDMGLGATVVTRVATARNNAERESVAATAFKLLLLPGAVIGALGLAGATLFSWTVVLGLPALHPPDADQATAAALMLFALSVPFGVGQRTLTGLGKNHIGIAITAFTSVGALVTTLVIQFGSFPPSAFATAQPVGILISAVVCTVVAQFQLRTTPWRLIKAPRVGIRSLITTATPWLLIMIGLPVALQSHRLLLSQFGTPSQLSEYSLMMQFYLPLWSVIAAGATALWPFFRSQAAPGREVRKALRRASLLLTTISVVAGTGMVLAGRPLGLYISHGQITLSTQTLFAAGALIVVQGLQQVPGMYFTDDRGLWFQVKCIMWFVLWTVGFSIALIPTLGASAPLWAAASGVISTQLLPGLLRLRRAPEAESP